jgi:IS30 family transposase
MIRLAAKGCSAVEIAEAVERSSGSVFAVLRTTGGVFRQESLAPPSPNRLSLDDRVAIFMGLERGESYAAIGKALGWHRSTIYREVIANGGRDGYRPVAAHRVAHERARRPKQTKLAANHDLCAWVIALLKRWWSPEQIARASRREFPDHAERQVSHETIYKSIYIQGRGELKRELAACLRTGRAKRKTRDQRERRGRLPDMVMISERPAEVADRAIPGHWEGDLVVGQDNQSAIGTIVERSSRFVMLLHLPNGHGAESVRESLTTAIKTLPEAIRRSLTWDQGREMAQHVQFSVDTGVDVYFCDPHSPWQRGSNENTNGLLRQYFPKGTDLSVHGPEVLQAAADSLNSRPRKTLGDMTPSQRLAELVAMTG